MKKSLRFKTGALLLLIAIILSTVAVCVSYSVYKNTMEDQYRKMTENLAHTEAIALDPAAAELLSKNVVAIYREQCGKYGGTIPFDEMSEDEEQAYYAAYDDAIKTDEYVSVQNMLRAIAKENDVASIYLTYMDLETNSVIYICDASDEDPCPTGVCDVMEEGNRRIMQSSGFDGFPAYITNYEEYGWLCTAGAGMFDESGRMYAAAYVDISMDDVVADRISFLRELSTILIGITLVASAAFILIVDKIVVRPVKKLAKLTSSFVEDNYTSENEGEGGSDLSIASQDEIGELYASVEKMKVDIHEYMTDLTAVTAEKERIGAELNVATKIQADMLPSIFPPFPERTEFDIFASMTPAKEVGGDFYDFFMVDDDHLAMVIADVSGKGVPAALFMVIAKTLLKNTAQQPGMTPKTILESVNNQLCENNQTGMFVTVWIGILEISTGKVTAANAGHEYPAIRHKDGSFDLIKDRHGFVLAGMEGARYREYEFEVEKGASLFVYTDGVAEATNAENELFGTDRMLEELNLDPQSEPKELIGQVLKGINAFVGEAPQFDDITMLCLEMKDE